MRHLTTDDYIATVASAWKGELVVCALGKSADGWWNATGSEEAYYVEGAMGFASSVGLGLALAIPEATVWVLDSDGGLAMNLGGVLTEASLQPANFLRIVLNNHGYQCLHGAELVNAHATDYAAVARGAKIQHVYTAKQQSDLRACIEECRSGEHHGFIVADVEATDRSQSDFQPPPPLPFEGPEIKYRFGRYIERRFGREVFGPQGV